MCSTLHLLVYLYTSSEIPSCCVQLQNTASWVVFHQKRFWGWNNYDQMCLWVNFSKHNTDINHVSSFSTPKPSLKKILMIIIVRFKCLSMDVRNYTFAGVFSSLNYNSVALHTRAEKKRHGKLSTKKKSLRLKRLRLDVPFSKLSIQNTDHIHVKTSFALPSHSSFWSLILSQSEPFWCVYSM